MVHGVLVQISGLGVLVTGDSGVGKTACGLDLVARGCLWVGDDAVVLERRGDALYGRGHERTKELIAVRGRGILDARSLLGAEALLEETQVHFVVRFIPPHRSPVADPGDGSGPFLEIEGIPVYGRAVVAEGDSGHMADEVIALVSRFRTGQKGRDAKADHTEADARGNHHGAVRLR